MVQTDGLRGGLLRESLAAAMRQRAGETPAGGAVDPSRAFDALVEQITRGVADGGRTARADGGGLVDLVREGLGTVQSELAATDRLPEQLVSGQVESFEELAAQVKRADLTFRFSLEIRNRLVDAYREVMRMTV
jgi:flagellar hook-basal body complex protein FliE